jgi:hypothetical protein
MVIVSPIRDVVEKEREVEDGKLAAIVNGAGKNVVRKRSPIASRHLWTSGRR